MRGGKLHKQPRLSRTHGFTFLLSTKPSFPVSTKPSFPSPAKPTYNMMQQKTLTVAVATNQGLTNHFATGRPAPCPGPGDRREVP